jgi:antitoxin (DNA-binding transcriptional repressor) of toxin-antitoxin stability system
LATILIGSVPRGEEVVIGKSKIPIAQLPDARSIDRVWIAAAIEMLKRLRRGLRLDSLSWKALRDEGRK